jgi:hypothetical protein
MNQVDIYIGNNRLDLFDDEEITINLSLQNYKELDKIFTDFTQSFTIPATGRNNEIFAHYYRTDVIASRITNSAEGGYPNWDDIVQIWGDMGSSWEGESQATSEESNFDGRLRPTARIEINSLLFRDGVIQMEQVLLKGTEPYAYTLTFYGYLVNLTDLFGDDYLYDLDLSAYDHDYDGSTILTGFNQDALFAGDIMYPLMSPVRNWVYNAISGSSSPFHEDDIQFLTGHSGHDHGVNYYELKPALKIVKILEAIESKYGVSFSGFFLTDATFQKLYLWAHRYEGYLFKSGTTIDWELINFNRNTGGGTEFNLTTDTWDVVTTDFYEINVTIDNASVDYELGLFVNGQLFASNLVNAHPASSYITTWEGSFFGFYESDEVKLYIRPQGAIAPSSMTYQCSDYEAIDSSLDKKFEVDQTASASYIFSLKMSPLMPEIKVADFLAGIVKMHNLVIVPTSNTAFSFYTLDDWYADGSDIDLQEFIDIDEVQVKRPDLFRRIEFNYQDTEQILGYQYNKTNQVGYGDLNSDFQFDGGEFKIELPFECPLFEILDNYENTDAPVSKTNLLAYKSQTREANTEYLNRFQTYVGAPVLIYGEFPYAIDANPIAFNDESDPTNSTECLEIWYANTSSTSSGIGIAKSLTWGADIDPYYLSSIPNSLYNTYWSDYITDLYAKNKRVFQVEAVLPLGKILNLNLNNLVIWNNQKFKINNANLNLATGKVRLELLNEV